MAYCLKITKKGEARYAQIVETFYDPVTKRSTSRSVESFGDLNKQLACDPEFENKLRQRIVMLNHDDSVLNVSKLDKSRSAESIFGVFKKPKLNDGLSPLNYGLAIERALWEELDLRVTLERLAKSCRPAFPYDLDLLSFFLVELKFSPPGMPLRSVDYRYNTILNFDNINAEQLVETIAFLGKRKDTILRQVRNQFILFDQVACADLNNSSPQDKHESLVALTTPTPKQADEKNIVNEQDHVSLLIDTKEQFRPSSDYRIRSIEQELSKDSLERRKAAKEQAERQHKRSQDRLCLQALFGPEPQNNTQNLIRDLTQGQASSILSAVDFTDKNHSSGLAQAVAQAVKVLGMSKSQPTETLKKALDKVDLKSISPFLGDTGVYDLRSIYLDCNTKQQERQQMILGVLMTSDGIPLDYDFLFFGKPNHFRPQTNLKQIVDSLNRFCALFNWQRIVIRADHTYNLTLLLIALTELKCEYVLCQSAEALPEAIRHQILSANAWQPLKKLPAQAGSLAADMHDPLEDWDDENLVNFDNLIKSEQFSKLSACKCQHKLNHCNCPILVHGEEHCHKCQSVSGPQIHHKFVAKSEDLHASLASKQVVGPSSLKTSSPQEKSKHHHVSSRKNTLPEVEASLPQSSSLEIDNEQMSPKELLKQQQSVAPDFKYQQFKLAAKNHELCPVGIALWSQKRTNAERYMWSLAQALSAQPQKMNIAGFTDQIALEKRSDAFQSLLGNYNATPPIDFDLLKKLEQSYLAGEKLDEAELHLLEQLQVNFLSGTLFFVTSKNLAPQETISLASLIAEAERYSLVFYRKLLTPWRWDVLRQISQRPEKLPPSAVGHYQGQVLVSFLAWIIEQWRSFRLFNQHIKCTAQELQKSLDLLNMVRFSDHNINHWIKLNVERLAQSPLSQEELVQVFACFNLTLPELTETDDSLKSKLKLNTKLIDGGA